MHIQSYVVKNPVIREAKELLSVVVYVVGGGIVDLQVYGGGGGSGPPVGGLSSTHMWGFCKMIHFVFVTPPSLGYE